MGPQLDSCGRRHERDWEGRAVQLQWGRNLIVAEGRWIGGEDRAVGASMGPQLDSCGRWAAEFDEWAQILLQWGRNLIVAEGKTGTLDWGFMSELQWGRNLIVAEGPSGRSAPAPTQSLQWGRNLIVAEGCECCGNVVAVKKASMGPQLDSCGRRAGSYVRNFSRAASMGPQLDSCGRRPAPRQLGRPRRRFNGAAT